jgi:Nuclease A inhibitor-like protein
MDITTKLYTSRLQTLTKDLLFMSESEYPWEIMYSGKSREEALQQLPFDSAQARQISLEHLLKNAIKEEDWHGEEEVAMAKKYQQLLLLLTEELSNINVFKNGEVEVDIYVLGQLPNEEWITLKTKSVET